MRKRPIRIIIIIDPAFLFNLAQIEENNEPRAMLEIPILANSQENGLILCPEGSAVRGQIKDEPFGPFASPQVYDSCEANSVQTRTAPSRRGSWSTVIIRPGIDI
jgi:hypothetical protein